MKPPDIVSRIAKRVNQGRVKLVKGSVNFCLGRQKRLAGHIRLVKPFGQRHKSGIPVTADLVNHWLNLRHIGA